MISHSIFRKTVPLALSSIVESNIFCIFSILSAYSVTKKKRIQTDTDNIEKVFKRIWRKRQTNLAVFSPNMPREIKLSLSRRLFFSKTKNISDLISPTKI